MASRVREDDEYAGVLPLDLQITHWGDDDDESALVVDADDMCDDCGEPMAAHPAPQIEGGNDRTADEDSIYEFRVRCDGRIVRYIEDPRMT